MTKARDIKASNIGLVIMRHGATVEVLAEDGTMITCHQRKSKNAAIAGDHVEWQEGTDEQGIITKRLTRKNVLAQRKNIKVVKEIAANLDQIVIAFTVKPHYDQFLIDRYIAIAEQQGITPVLLVTKLDLITDDISEDIEQLMTVYRDIGYHVISSSQKNQTGLNIVQDILKDKTSVLVGQSGVGKSSIATALLPGITIATGELTARGDQGSHTTSTTMLYALPMGGYLVDSPGVRDFSMWDLAADELANCYIEFKQHTDECKFHNCRHLNEPICGVKSAIDRKEVSQLRYNSYVATYNALSTDQ
ncbi:MAG: ribosome small subunit-dependent GTPase A [Gammaproteobacteria bacterium]|nr:ribosome small subunit-dependent GTPase A [Gammaproteobacteria bacterium]